jgi:hypothetical protein
MGMDGSTRATAAHLKSLARIGVAALASAFLCLCAAGCSTAPQGTQAATPGAMAAAVPHGPTVAFDSIIGPPPTIFDSLVSDLSQEASIHQVAVVSRESQAQYRVRGYLAALVEGKRRNTVISWVWDVYDADQHRAMRLSGQLPASGSGRGTWAAADDGVLRRIAATSMDQLAAFLAAPPAPAPMSQPGPNIAANSPDPASSTLAYMGGRP